MDIGSLFLKIGIKADSQSLSRINTGFKDMRAALVEIQVAFAAAIYGLDKFISGTVNGVAALQNLNQQTGLSIDLIQKWQQAGQLSNLALNADTIANSIGNLQKNLSAIKIGQGNVSPFQMLGIDVGNKDAFGVLDELRDRIKGLEPGIASNLISQLGLDPAMISVLKLSNQEFEKLGKNSFLGKGGRAAVASMGLTIRELTLRLGQLKDLIVAKLAPALTRIVNDFLKWISKNQGQIVGAIGSIVNAIKSFVVAFGNAIDLGARFIDGVTGMQSGIKILATGFAFLALSFRPVLLGLFLIVALLDDIAVWNKGGDSLFGEFYDAIAQLGKDLKPLKDMFIGFKDAISDAFGFDDKTMKNIGILSSFFSVMGEFLKSIAVGAIGGFAVAGPVGALAGGVITGTLDAIAQAVRGGKGVVKTEEAIYDKGKTQHGSTRAITQNNTFNVHGTGNPAEVTRDAYSKAINIEDLKDSLTSFGNGGI